MNVSPAQGILRKLAVAVVHDVREYNTGFMPVDEALLLTSAQTKQEKVLTTLTADHRDLRVDLTLFSVMKGDYT